MHKSLKNDNSGVALIAVIMSMLVLSMLTASTLSMTTSNLKNALDEREFQAAYYIAEAGANYGMEYYKSKIINNEVMDPLLLNVDSGHFDEQYGDKPEASVNLTGPEAGEIPQEEIYKIESTGTIDGISRTVIKTFILKRTSGGGSGWKSEYAILTKGNMDVGSGEINGPIFSNGDIKLSNGGTKVNGNVYSKGNLVFTDSAKVYGDTYVKGYLEFNNWGAFISKDAYTLEDIYIGGDNTNIKEGHIGGNIYAPASGTEEGFIKMEGVELPSEDSFPAFPEFPDESSCVIKDKNDIVDGVLDIRGPNRATYIPTSTVKFPISSPYIAEITIKYDDNDILMVDNLDIGWSRINLEGSGRLNLYIKGTVKLNGLALNIPIGQTRDNYTVEQAKECAQKLAIYVKADDNEATNKQITIGGSDVVIGSVFAEDGNFTLSDSGKFHGNLVTRGKKIEISGSAKAITQLIYAPNAHVDMLFSGNLKGPIIANTFKSTGEGNVNYDPESDSEEVVEDPFFPSTGDKVELIPGPLTEK